MFDFVEQKYFDSSAGYSPGSQPGFEYFGIIYYETVAGVQEVDDFRELMMIHRAVFPVQSHKPGGITPFGRVIGQQFFGQIIIEKLYIHTISLKNEGNE